MGFTYHVMIYKVYLDLELAKAQQSSTEQDDRLEVPFKPQNTCACLNTRHSSTHTRKGLKHMYLSPWSNEI